MTRNLLPITLLAFLFLATFPLSHGEEKPSDSDAVNVKSFTDKGVMMFGDISDGKSPFAKDPTVKKFRGKYFMYYSVLTLSLIHI